MLINCQNGKEKQRQERKGERKNFIENREKRRQEGQETVGCKRRGDNVELFFYLLNEKLSLKKQ